MVRFANSSRILNNSDVMGLVLKRGLKVIIAIAIIASPTAFVSADPQSANYKLVESGIGSGSLIQSSSTNYTATEALGDISIGTSNSTNFQVSAGSKTPSDPNLSVSITDGAIDFPDFSASTPSVATATFSVLNYTSYGYVVQIGGLAPSNDGYELPALASGTTSFAGTEQFGLNLVANTSPTSIGANPDNDEFGFGSAAPNYGVPNTFRYVSGETIAIAPKSSGLTHYTITYLVNVAGLTPGGKYTSQQTLIITGTY
jgi:hypothetical protein